MDQNKDMPQHQDHHRKEPMFQEEDSELIEEQAKEQIQEKLMNPQNME